ncbi:hypothetical protein C2E20_4726 [Micractinium conductrix]|uniref:Uncharacterized protein n=1 Tax=Micractinium conductrix TaxID=554055 RepID=A0A2P6VD54_9CHLO|nr:hypothetical protein C2E20_4726 [Micractinium conductrix]|eukprot:PSC72009.1 hypothetical protein C2E20_4726 [Micractinium conductrix]
MLPSWALGGDQLHNTQAAAAPGWALADDVFAQRNEAGVSHTEGAWQPLPRLALQLEGAGAQRRGGTAAAAAPAWRSASAAPPQQEPWLLAAGAYAADGGAGWAAAAAAGGVRATRARMLFQYKPYSQQEPLALSDEEVAAVVEAAFGRWGSTTPSLFKGEASSLWDSLSHGERYGLAAAATTGEVAAVILTKLVMDLYVRAGPCAAFPLALLLLQKPLLSGDAATQARVFDFVFNLAVHGELLYDAAAEALPEDAPALADAVAELGVASGAAPPSNAAWKATVTSAFRATLASTLRGSTAVAAGSGNARGSLDGGRSGGSGGGHAPTRSSLDGRTLWGSADAGHPARGAAGGRTAAASPAGEWPPLLEQRPPPRSPCGRCERFQQWLRLLLFQLLEGLAAGAGGIAAAAAPEGPWVAALSCLVHLSTHSGAVPRAYVEELPPSVVAALLEQCRRHRWSEHLHAWLVTLAANLLYVHTDGSDDYGPPRSIKALSMRSDGAGSTGRASYAGGGGAAGAGDPSWWGGSQLDFGRLRAFGGVRQVLRCFREAPTVTARRNMFAVLYDYVVAGQEPSREDAWAPVLMHTAHSSETLALGAALLRMGAPEAVHPLLLAGVPGAMQRLADAVSMQMAALQSSNPGRVVSVPGAMVGEVMECLEEIAANDAQVPAALQEAVRLTLDAVASPEAAPGGGSSAAEGSAAWGCLADCMRDGSELGSRAGRGWLLQLLVTAAEHELARSGGSGEQQQGLDEPETPGAARSGGGTNGATAAPALLPEVSAHGGCQLQPGRRGMRGQGELRQLLMRALATTPDSRAADCFISAVGSLMAHVRLRCAADGWNGTDGWGGSGGDEAAATPLPPSASSASMRGASSAARLAAASPHSHSRQTSKMTAGASVDSLPDAETSAVRVVPSESGTSGQQSLPMDGAGGMWRALNCADAVLATLSLAVEWLLQAPQEVRQSAMLRAAQLLLTFTLSPRHAQQHARGGAAAPAGSSSEALESVFPGSVAASPGITPTRQQPAQHRLAGQAPAPLQLPPSPGMSPSAPEMLTPGGLPPRPVSPSLAALKAAAAAASGAGAASADSKRPSTPRAGSFERLQGAAEPTSISATALAAAAAPLGGPLPPAGDGQAGQAEAAAAAACEASATVLWSFLSGQAMVPHELLRLVPPLVLRMLFEDLRPDCSSLHYDALATAGAGAPASRLTRAADAALGFKATVQADQPLWDARAAVLLLLMARCACDSGALGALGGTAFFCGLLSEPDIRVRHYASVFVLRQLMLQQPLQYRRALRGVVARAQSANDERLLANPHLQLRGMLDLGRVQLDQLV